MNNLEMMENLYRTAIDCIDYVGRSNSRIRIKISEKCIDKSFETGFYFDPELLENKTNLE